MAYGYKRSYRSRGYAKRGYGRRSYGRGYRKPRGGYSYPSRRFYGMRPRRFYIGGRRY